MIKAADDDHEELNPAAAALARRLGATLAEAAARSAAVAAKYAIATAPQAGPEYAHLAHAEPLELEACICLEIALHLIGGDICRNRDRLHKPQLKDAAGVRLCHTIQTTLVALIRTCSESD